MVFSAGAGGRGGPEATNAIDGEAAVRLVDAASAAGVRRFVLVSVFMDAGPRRPGAPTPSRTTCASSAPPTSTSPPADLDWTILRPGTLTDDPGTGTVRLGPAIG